MGRRRTEWQHQRDQGLLRIFLQPFTGTAEIALPILSSLLLSEIIINVVLLNHPVTVVIALTESIHLSTFY